eukprot:492783_1
MFDRMPETANQIMNESKITALTAYCSGWKYLGTNSPRVIKINRNETVQPGQWFKVSFMQALLNRNNSPNQHYVILYDISITCKPPTSSPTKSPTNSPLPPTMNPTLEPTVLTMDPSVNPTLEPTVYPTLEPTIEPTASYWLCETNPYIWCYYIEIYPADTIITTTIVNITDIDRSANVYFNITFIPRGAECHSPHITFEYEQIDISSNNEYISVFNNKGALLKKCQGNGGDDIQCNVWWQCLSNYSLGITQ